MLKNHDKDTERKPHEVAKELSDYLPDDLIGLATIDTCGDKADATRDSCVVKVEVDSDSPPYEIALLDPYI